MRTFKISEQDLHPGAREIAVEGELDLAVAPQLAQALEGSDCRLTLVSLAECDFIDSTGIAVIVRAHQAAAQGGRAVVAHSPSPPVLRVLSVTGLTDNGLVFSSREAALAVSASTF